MAHEARSLRLKGDLDGLPVWDELIVYACALCHSEITVKFHGRAPSAFCRSCTGRLARLKKQWGYRHGQSRTPVYNCWYNMRARCNRPTHPSYKDYGGRGIRVPAEWDLSFQAFYEWSIANGWTTGLSLDRRDNDGPYGPDNCRWVHPHINAQNRRGVRYPADVISEIRRMIESGKSYRDIDAIYPLKFRHYKEIKYRERWKNVA